MSALAGDHCNPWSLHSNCRFGDGLPNSFPLLCAWLDIRAEAKQKYKSGNTFASPVRVVGVAQILIGFDSSQFGHDLNDIEHGSVCMMFFPPHCPMFSYVFNVFL